MAEPLLSFTRRRDDRVVAGVASGFAATHGADPFVVRVAIVVMSLAGGVGVAFYLAAVLLIAEEEEDDDDDDTTPRRVASSTRRNLAVGAAAAALLAFVRATPLWLGDAVMGPIAVIAVGLSVLATGTSDSGRSPWGPIPASRFAALFSGPHRSGRLLLGGALLAAGVVAAGGSSRLAVGLRTGALGAVLAFAGVSLVIGPWFSRVAQQLGEERRERIRSEERAALAAHLHDLVLQTLALIQRNAGDPRTTLSLARRQERELRDWLYSKTAGDAAVVLDDTFANAISRVVTEVESLHPIRIELVTVGDRAMDAPLTAVVAALREALVNAGKHAGVEDVSCYVEVTNSEVTAFVRDRGKGFDPALVPGDRQGVARSIRARMVKAGGSAELESVLGEGTEVHLVLPLTPSSDVSP